MANVYQKQRSVNVVSVIRLRSLVKFGNSTNPTYDQYDVIYWSTIETNIGMICTCLPTMRLMLVRLFPKIIGSGTRSGGYATGTSASLGKGVSGGNYDLSERGTGKGKSWTRIGMFPTTCTLDDSRSVSMKLIC